MSAIFAEAAQRWQEMSLDFLSYVDDAYNKALEATAGVLVSAAGREQHIDGYILFRGQRAFAEKYASEELLEHWREHPRLTMAEYEIQWMSGTLDYAEH